MGNYIKAYGPDLSQVLVPFVLEPFLPRIVRPFNYAWGVDAFPSAVEGEAGEDVSYCEADLLMIPRGAKHPREAFEFMAYVQRPQVMEKLCKLTWKNSPRRQPQRPAPRPDPHLSMGPDADRPGGAADVPTAEKSARGAGRCAGDHRNAAGTV
jgi:hypothetical protein